MNAAFAAAFRDPRIVDEVRRLSLVSDVRGAAAVVRQWILIVACIAGAAWIDSPVAYLAAIVVVAGRQHALGVLMHDAAHYRLFSSRWLNDTVSDLCCALPLGLVTVRYRYDHLRHHQHAVTTEDPYWVTMQEHPAGWRWPKSPARAALALAGDLVGPGAVAFHREWSAWLPWPNHFSTREYPVRLDLASRVRCYVFFLTAGAAVAYTGAWWGLFAFWMVPLLTFLQVFLRIRGVAEHLAPAGEAGLNATRDTVPTVLELATVAPLSVSYHLTHHMFPGVPYYNLARLSARLRSDPAFRAHARVSIGYFGSVGVVWREMIRRH
jgi:fatty acid desaturase